MRTNHSNHVSNDKSENSFRRGGKLKMNISDTYPLFLQEGHLIQSCLCSGLTSLRRATRQDKGGYYSAFFQLSIGLERLLKVTLVLNHMAENKLETPSFKTVKNFGHDLSQLIELVCDIDIDLQPHPMSSIGPSTIEQDIISFLAEFAKTTRYSNLDKILNSQKSYEDPLIDWNKIFERIIRDDAPQNSVKKLIHEGNAMANMMQGIAFTFYYGIDGNVMNDSEAYMSPKLDELGARYAVLRVMNILKSLHTILFEVNHKALTSNHSVQQGRAIIPNIYEFTNFVLHERRDILRKKNWP